MVCLLGDKDVRSLHTLSHRELWVVLSPAVGEFGNFPTRYTKSRDGRLEVALHSPLEIWSGATDKERAELVGRIFRGHADVAPKLIGTDRGLIDFGGAGCRRGLSAMT